MGDPPITFFNYVLALAVLFLVEYIQEFCPGIKVMRNTNVVIRFSGYILIIILLIATGVFGGANFIYFQF
jgi:hypothetical protein